MKKRSFFKRTDLFIIAGLVVVALLAFFLFSLFSRTSDRMTAVISVDGEDIMQVDLSEEREPYTISLHDQGIPVEFEVNDHRIRFINVDCPDKICENTGYVDSDGETAVCMPNKTVLTVHAEA